MRIVQMSDIHLEFEFYLPRSEGEILMLNGDICVADYFTKTQDSKYWIKGERQRKFFQFCAENYEHVIYVMGNHEHYSSRFDKTADIIRENIPESIHFLDNSCVDIGDTRFIGFTLWTDTNRNSPITQNCLMNGMTDYKIIKYKYDNGYGKLSPSVTYDEHQHSLRILDMLAYGHDKVCVVSHHAPSGKSIHPKYDNEYHMNGGYYSTLDQFILDRPQIKLWTHGHMHDNFDYQIGDCRVVCTPKGYYDENKYFKERIIDL